MSKRSNERSRKVRSRFPVHAYVGLNGSGKTLAAVYDSMVSLAAGRPVLSSVRLTDWTAGPCDDGSCDSWRHPDHGRAHPGWVPFTTWDQLLEAEHCDVLMDEVAGIASSRASAALPGAIEVVLQQLRRRDVVLRWTAPAWARADVVIRECTSAVTVCKGYLVDRSGDDDAAMWRPRRLFRWKTYDRRDFDNADAVMDQKARAVATAWFWGPGSDAFRAYDSVDDVLLVGTVTESGRCVVCGGRRNVPTCHCDERPGLRRRRVPLAGAGAAGPDAPAPTGEGERA